MIAGSFRVSKLSTSEEAGKIVDFFFSPESFDDIRHTPGEVEHFRSLPHRALCGESVFWYVADKTGRIIGVNSVAENEQRTGGYSWDYVVVHRNYRKAGVASALIEEMLSFLEQALARYVVTYTCSLPEYDAIRRLFERNEFRVIGRLPDYYFAGEDRLIYYRPMS
jgi:ribosomal protein S18 acetylase RimI-like enzyme